MKRSMTGIACAIALLGATTMRAESGRFHDGTAYNASDMELRVAAAVDRGDGHWLVLGSRMLPDNRETPYLSLRTHAGRFVAAVGLDPGEGRSWSPGSMLAIGGGAAVVIGVDYDTVDFEAPRRMFAIRVDAGLGITWARSIGAHNASIPHAMPRRHDSRIGIVGSVQPMVEGTAAAGDAFVAELDQQTGSISGARTIGTPEDDERGADIGFSANDRVVLLEVPRGPARTLPADGLVGLSEAGMLTAAHLSGHAINAPIRASALRLWPAADGWTIAGRRAVFGPNFFYLQHVAADLAPSHERTLIPFFNVSDILPTSGGARLLGQANDEISDRGTVLMTLDEHFGIRKQQRFGTQTLAFPTGALTRGDGGLLFAFGGVRESDGRVFESVDRIDAATDESLLCDQEKYSGFSTIVDTAADAGSWEPQVSPLDLLSADVHPVLEALVPEAIPECTHAEDLIFSDGVEPRNGDLPLAHADILESGSGPARCGRKDLQARMPARIGS
jgi:hypothetical protein